MNDTPYPLLAAVGVGRTARVDALLEGAARALAGEGVRVAGFLQREGESEGACCATIEVEDIAAGRRFVISQDLGPGARGCRLDPQALAALVVPTIESLARAPDLLVLNRFGKAEAEGGGWRAVFEEAFSRSIPVLTAAREEYAPAWNDFTGELGLVLPPEEPAVLRWARAAMTARRQAGHAT